MAANVQNQATNNAHLAIIDGATYKCTDLRLRRGGSKESVMSGDDAGHERDVKTASRTTVSGTCLIPKTGEACPMEALEEYACTFVKKAGLAVAGDFIFDSFEFAGSTASALKFSFEASSQGEVTWNTSGTGSPG